MHHDEGTAEQRETIFRLLVGDLRTTVLRAMDAPDDAFAWNTGSGANGRPLNSGPLAELRA